MIGVIEIYWSASNASSNTDTAALTTRGLGRLAGELSISLILRIYFKGRNIHLEINTTLLVSYGYGGTEWTIQGHFVLKIVMYNSYKSFTEFFLFLQS